MARLPRDFFFRDARDVARDLLGRTLVTTIDGLRTSGQIIETEAYLGKEDMASHAFRGPTSRNSAMFLSGGHAYIYFIYGMYHCFNVVTGDEGTGEAVLIRGLRPIDGIETMRARRGGTPRNDAALADGPGKLTIALGIGPAFNGTDLNTDPRIRIDEGRPLGDGEVLATPRIGITKSVEHPWRWIAASAVHPKRRAAAI